jgi:uncharacterized protein YecE (DUF72 family)
MQGSIHIGTSGWSYNHWRNLYYPEGLTASKWLRFYAQQFQTTEINGCFYRLPAEQTVLKWMDDVPPGFRFCPKMSRYLTHMKKLRDPEEPLERFFSVFDPMKNVLGPVLVQLPHQLGFHLDTVQYFYEQLKRYGDHRFVIEVRHPAWLQEESIALMKAYEVGFVISHSDGTFPYAEHVTSDVVYVRFHGPAELYASPYPDKMLRAYAKKFLSWAELGKQVWAFFNNDIHGYAPHDALRLQKMVAAAIKKSRKAAG